MQWDVEYTDEFGYWWETLSEDERASLDAGVALFFTGRVIRKRRHQGFR